jgi:GTP-binding protein HflX
LGIERLLARIDEELVADPVVEQRFEIPQSQGTALAALGAGALIREREFVGNSVRMTVAGPASLLGRYREFRVE